MADMKPKKNDKNPAKDLCMTPDYAVRPLVELLKSSDNGFNVISEPCSGQGDLVKSLKKYGYDVFAGDIATGQDFFAEEQLKYINNPIITNPPYSIKERWIRRCYELTNNWALLLPVESLASSRLNEMFQAHGGISVLFFDSRIDFKLPDGDWGHSSAQFPTCWIISGFGVEVNKMFYSSIKEEKSSFKKLHRMMGT